LAFVGLDWERKRGDLAVETARALVRRGYKVRLEVIGAVPPTPYDPDLVTVHGYVSKATPAGRALFQDIMGRAHLVLVPTKQECFGIFAAEANAYGLPVISTDTGGLADVIENGVNGYLLPLAAGAEAYADKIAEVFENRGLYENLRAGSLARSRTVLNWQAWGHRAAEVIDTVAHDKRA
jgi:glycosyltransferase involved in cell wall biosynthesis